MNPPIILGNYTLPIYKDGRKATFYEVVVQGESKSEFRKTLESIRQEDPEAFNAFTSYVTHMTERVGCQDQYFKLNEGARTDAVCALHYKNYRIYCLRFGNICIILGGGGLKQGRGSPYQNYPELHEQVGILQDINEIIDELGKDFLITNQNKIQIF